MRISTTVDGERLETARRMLGVSDARLIDRALEALVDLLEGEQERRALDQCPYEDDPDLSWSIPESTFAPMTGPPTA